MTKLYKASEKEEVKVVDVPSKEEETKHDDKPEQLSFLDYINDL